MDKHRIDGNIATDREEKPAATDLENTDRKFVKADFTYDVEADVFICLTGEKMYTNPASKAKKVEAGFSLVCTAHNIKKFVKAASAGSVRLEDLKKRKKVA